MTFLSHQKVRFTILKVETMNTVYPVMKFVLFVKD